MAEGGIMDGRGIVAAEATRPMRQAAGRIGDIERLSLWSGQAPSLARRIGSADLVRRLLIEAAGLRARLV